MPELRLGKNREAIVCFCHRLHECFLDRGDASLFGHAVQLRTLRLGQLVGSSGFQVPAFVEEIGGHHLAGCFGVGWLRKVEYGPIGQFGILE